MKVFQTSFFILAIVVVATLAKKTDDEEWEDFKKKHGRKHKDANDEAKRKGHFLKVHRQIEEHNKSNKPWQLTHNQFSDRTEEEKNSLLGYKQNETFPNMPRYVTDETADLRQLDYRNDSCVGPVKDQGACGSCWAFATVVPLEFQLCKFRRAYISLSEQQLVDCACYGCGGGYYYAAWAYLSSTSTGIVSSTTHPYRQMKGTCQQFSNGLTKPVYQMSVSPNAQSIMYALKSYGPLSIAMNVPQSFFQYSSGVYDPAACPNTIYDLNHAMSLVGYGKDAASGLDYWVVRNSWGKTWGKDGYILVRRGINRCGIEINVGLVLSNPTL